MKAILKASQGWHVVGGTVAARSSSSHRDRMDTRGDGPGEIVASDFAKDVACSVILRGPGGTICRRDGSSP